MTIQRLEEAIEGMPNTTWHSGKTGASPLIRIRSGRQGRLLDLSKKSDIDTLVDLCVLSPVGKGPNDVYDESVRKCVQTDESKVNIEFPEMESILRDVKETLAPFWCLDEARAKFFKLLVYRKGDFFRVHRDSRKGDNHSLTLAVDCGSPCKGGRVVFPKGREGAESDSEPEEDDENFDEEDEMSDIFDDAPVGAAAAPAAAAAAAAAAPPSPPPSDSAPPRRRRAKGPPAPMPDEDGWESAGVAGAWCSWFNSVFHMVEEVTEGHRVVALFNIEYRESEEERQKVVWKTGAAQTVTSSLPHEATAAAASASASSVAAPKKGKRSTRGPSDSPAAKASGGGPSSSSSSSSSAAAAAAPAKSTGRRGIVVRAKADSGTQKVKVGKQMKKAKGEADSKKDVRRSSRLSALSETLNLSLPPEILGLVIAALDFRSLSAFLAASRSIFSQGKDVLRQMNPHVWRAARAVWEILHPSKKRLARGSGKGGTPKGDRGGGGVRGKGRGGRGGKGAQKEKEEGGGRLVPCEWLILPLHHPYAFFGTKKGSPLPVERHGQLFGADRFLYEGIRQATGERPMIFHSAFVEHRIDEEGEEDLSSKLAWFEFDAREEIDKELQMERGGTSRGRGRGGGQGRGGGRGRGGGGMVHDAGVRGFDLERARALEAQKDFMGLAIEALRWLSDMGMMGDILDFDKSLSGTRGGRGRGRGRGRGGGRAESPRGYRSLLNTPVPGPLSVVLGGCETWGELWEKEGHDFLVSPNYRCFLHEHDSDAASRLLLTPTYSLRYDWKIPESYDQSGWGDDQYGIEGALEDSRVIPFPWPAAIVHADETGKLKESVLPDLAEVQFAINDLYANCGQCDLFISKCAVLMIRLPRGGRVEEERLLLKKYQRVVQKPDEDWDF